MSPDLLGRQAGFGIDTDVGRIAPIWRAEPDFYTIGAPLGFECGLEAPERCDYGFVYDVLSGRIHAELESLKSARLNRTHQRICTTCLRIRPRYLTKQELDRRAGAVDETRLPRRERVPDGEVKPSGTITKAGSSNQHPIG